MITFSAFTEDSKIAQDAHHSLVQEFGDEVEFNHISDYDSMEFHLYYEMPNFVLFDLDQSSEIAHTLIPKLTNDPWLSSTGIFGVTTQTDNAQHISEYRGVFSFLQPSQVGSLLPNLVRVLSSNTQLLLPGNMVQDLGNSGSFLIENKPYLLEAYAELLATTLYNQNLTDIQGKYGLKFSLVEMLMNAVEHGNCDISNQEKKEWLETGHSILELIEEKCKNPEVSKKKVALKYSIGDEFSTFVITDEGEGFDTSTLAGLENANPLELHGRGVFMTRHYVASLQYNEKGNEVTLVFTHQPDTERVVPEGFKSSQTVQLAPGDVVFQKNDRGDTLYYIISGEFEVIVNDMVVNTLNSTSVFLGEMAFLLGNRRTATVRAKTEARLVAVSVKEWIDAVREYPYYGIFLARLISQKLDRQTRNIVSTATNTWVE